MGDMSSRAHFAQEAPRTPLSRLDWQLQFSVAKQTKTANVVCMKWGTLYSADWVNKLYGMVKRNTTWNIRFVCLTDDPSGIRPEVECRPLPALNLAKSAFAGKRNGTDPWWNKLSVFREALYDLSGMTLYLDLDVVIVGNIDSFFTHPGRFCMMQVWRPQRYAGPIGNSSIVRFFIGREKSVFEKFQSQPFAAWEKLYGGSQQRFLSANVEDLSFFPAAWCTSFKDCLPRNTIVRYFSRPELPQEAKIVVFYGAYTPAAALRGELSAQKKRTGARQLRLKLYAKRFRAPRWLKENWVG